MENTVRNFQKKNSPQVPENFPGINGSTVNTEYSERLPGKKPVPEKTEETDPAWMIAAMPSGAIRGYAAAILLVLLLCLGAIIVLLKN